jgi:hypothetical protein
MLTEEEWQHIEPLLVATLVEIKRYRENAQCSLEEAMAKGGFGHPALEAYEKLTGFKETNANALYHHRLSLYGPPCDECGKPLRTPIARYCAACGNPRPLSQYDIEKNRFAT